MILQQTNPAASTRRILAAALLILSLIALNRPSARAESSEPEPRRIPITISKGQNYTIADVNQGEGAPATKVIDNPNALVIQDAPGRIELVGADAGTWEIKVTLASGEKVIYVVTVKSDAPPQGDLNPGAAPSAIP